MCWPFPSHDLIQNNPPSNTRIPFRRVNVGGKSMLKRGVCLHAPLPPLVVSLISGILHICIRSIALKVLILRVLLHLKIVLRKRYAALGMNARGLYMADVGLPGISNKRTLRVPLFARLVNKLLDIR